MEIYERAINRLISANTRSKKFAERINKNNDLNKCEKDELVALVLAGGFNSPEELASILQGKVSYLRSFEDGEGFSNALDYQAHCETVARYENMIEAVRKIKYLDLILR